ncbi:MAG TPA: carboxypeptidase-like regulatory domain-containing protein [Thermoanaerobaculia bacterium]|nr:carboxypeptidase-like regulatory domain-containing protein [Thermoanaerobaculia bacterium]
MVVFVSIVGCTHTARHDIPQPPYESQLHRAIKCEAHILSPWRTVYARSFRGRVLISGEQQVFPGAVVALRKRGGQRIIEIEADERGRFEITNLRSGVYEFVACTRDAGMDPDMGWVVVSRRASAEGLELFLRYGV